MQKTIKEQNNISLHLKLIFLCLVKGSKLDIFYQKKNLYFYDKHDVGISTAQLT